MYSLPTKFTPLRSSPRTRLLSHVRRYPLYSDFNEASLWSWDIGGQTATAWLYNNLVIEFKDYCSDARVVTTLGNNHIQATMEELLRYTAQQSGATLGLIPEVSLQGFDPFAAGVTILAQPDQADYLYRLHPMAELLGSAYRTKRTSCNAFGRYKAEFRRYDLRDQAFRNHAIELYERWAEARSPAVGAYSHPEYEALRRCLVCPMASSLLAHGLTIGTRLIGFCITQRQHGGACLAHFMKTDHQYIGVTDYLLWRVAAVHRALGDEVINCEQDLGIPGLRAWKQGWRPETLLRKYAVIRLT